jgi:bacillithiol biosynthesis deacetylase BshB1
MQQLPAIDTALDVLVLCAHPDDAELGCGGTLAKLAASGKSVGVVDLTRGELGTRGTPESRAVEALEASRILGLALRGNLALPDGKLNPADTIQREAVIQAIRLYRPTIVLTNAPADRHPDHGNGCRLVTESAFLSGLRQWTTVCPLTGETQDAHRPDSVFQFIQDQYITPSFVVDISQHFELKMQAIRAYGSQFHVAGQLERAEPVTYISRPVFLEYVTARARHMGHLAGVDYGEGFISTLLPRYDSLPGMEH